MATTDSSCTEPRDRVYALLPLMSVEEQLYFKLEADYSAPGTHLAIKLACAFLSLLELDLRATWNIVKPLAEALCRPFVRSIYSLIEQELRDCNSQAWWKHAWQSIAYTLIRELELGGKGESRDGG